MSSLHPAPTNFPNLFFGCKEKETATPAVFFLYYHQMNLMDQNIFMQNDAPAFFWFIRFIW